ncbi:hypothetical protein LSCM1_07496 [Leishmania martiniquensis]|uniref:Phospholipid/glycerol acyltransferase domain-containing protein n=1 Tax=Leishmania martiniquensis TaxID=1580590 RepID=A0A836H9Y0_9TRYP|nr:hypothetical protein LSCM1_07496 [Leishmania martiniquensis]
MMSARMACLSQEAVACLPKLTRGQRGIMLVVALGAGYTLLRRRLVPKWVMQKWFLLCAAALILPSAALIHLFDPLRYVGVPQHCLQSICVCIVGYAFKAVWWANPQIHTRVKFDANEDGKPVGWDDIARTSIALALNHTSFWDTFEVVGITPMSHLLHIRTLMKASLRRIPIFGGVFNRVGHFPVYFTSDADGNFQVDKEKQAVVQERVNAHLRRGGSLVFFPEGTVNRTPETLKAFRFGTFATIMEHRLPVYYMVAVGGEKTWPPQMPYGGLPADVHIRIGRFPIDFDQESSKSVAVRLQQRMQQVRDEIAAEVATAEAAQRRHENPVAESKEMRPLGGASL